MHFFHRTITAAFVSASLLAMMLFVSAPALAISVQINGNTVALTPPPIERAGRVFVPGPGEDVHSARRPHPRRAIPSLPRANAPGTVSIFMLRTLFDCEVSHDSSS